MNKKREWIIQVNKDIEKEKKKWSYELLKKH